MSDICSHGYRIPTHMPCDECRVILEGEVEIGISRERYHVLLGTISTLRTELEQARAEAERYRKTLERVVEWLHNDCKPMSPGFSRMVDLVRTALSKEES